MKKLLFVFFLFVMNTAWAQIKPVYQKTNRVILPAKASIIRNDIGTLKSQLAQMTDSLTVIKREIDQLSTQKNSMNEMGEAEGVRLQMAMDRLSKMMSTLSNAMKKISDTQQGIIQNMK